MRHEGVDGEGRQDGLSEKNKAREGGEGDEEAERRRRGQGEDDGGSSVSLSGIWGSLLVALGEGFAEVASIGSVKTMLAPELPMLLQKLSRSVALAEEQLAPARCDGVGFCVVWGKCGVAMHERGGASHGANREATGAIVWRSCPELREWSLKERGREGS